MVTTIVGLGRPRLRVLDPRTTGWGERLSIGYWHRDRKRESAAGAAVIILLQASRAPPQRRRE